MTVSPSRRRNPWWIPPFLGRVPELEDRHLAVLGLVSLALLFENYDFSLLGAALKHIAEDLAIPEAELGVFTGLIRLGAIPVLLVIPLADRIGRRRVFLGSVAALSLGTFLTAFAPSPAVFVAIQIGTRTAMVTAAALAFVIVAEELPALHRGWGLGMLGAVSSIGHGLGAALFAAVDVLPFGWRALYVVGVLPLLFLPMLRRNLAETERFLAHRATGGMRPSGWFEPIVALGRSHPGRAFAIAVLGAVVTAGTATVFQFIGFFVLQYREWEPWQFSLMFVLGGAVGILGNIAAGRLGDLYGRRVTGFVFMALFPLVAGAFFFGPGWSVPFTWIALVFAVSASNIIVRAFSTELFPTAYRSTSVGWLNTWETLGATGGLALLSMGMSASFTLPLAITAISGLSAVGAVVVLAFPETRQQELEMTSGDVTAPITTPGV